MAFRTLAALLASLALIPAAVAEASAKPKFPRTVSGTISGSSSSTRGNTVKETWMIKGVRFKLEHVRFVENTWTGFYKVTAGTKNDKTKAYVFLDSFALSSAPAK